MEYKDYYKTLGLERSASQDEIKKVYRKLAMQYHPDKNPGDKQAEEHFKDINEAYQVLGDEDKRRKYDQLGTSYNQWQQTGAPGNFNWEDWFSQSGGGARRTRVDINDFGDVGDMFGGGGFSDFFNMIFGGLRGNRAGGQVRTQTRPKQRYETPVTISFDEAYSGTERMIQVNGRKLQVSIPRGAKNGTKVRMADAGPVNALGQKSDLYLVIEVTPDKRYEMNGTNLQTEASIDLFTAVLGGEVNVQTPSGNVLLTIPAGTQSGQRFRLGNKGMPRLKSPSTFGDLYVKVNVQIPKDLTDEQRKLYEQLKKIS